MAAAERVAERHGSPIARHALARLVSAEGISVAGDWVLNTAASIAVYRETESTVAVSALLGLAAVPTVLIGPFAGATADRHERRRIMVIADMLSAAILALAVGASVVGAQLAAVYVAVFALAVLSAFRRPAAEALRPAVAGDDQIGRANSMLQLASRLAMILGPAFASGLMVAGGLTLVLVVDAVSFVASALLVRGIGYIQTEPGEDETSPFRAALEGLRYATRSSNLRTVIGAIGIIMLLAPVVNAGTLALVKEALGLPESRYGVLLATEGVGAMALATLFTSLGPKLRLLPIGAAALALTGAATVVVGQSRNFETALTGMALMGMGVVGLQICLATYLQKQSPDTYRGRVMGLTSMTASSANIAGFALAGPLVYLLGVRGAFSLAGIIIAAAGLPILGVAMTDQRAPRT
ncbi:MAG: MFS transporter [Dehalococcoidia bacterium]|nr:MFS transporter [Dehalococcoidia bacterium]